MDNRLQIALVRRAICGGLLSREEWGEIPTGLLCAAAIILQGRLFEIGFIGIEATNPASDIEGDFRRAVFDRSTNVDTVIIDVVEKSPRASELLGPLKTVFVAYQGVRGEIQRRADRSSPATLAMLRARSTAFDNLYSEKELQKALKIEKLRDYRDLRDPRDLRHDAILGAVEAFNSIWNQSLSDTVCEGWSSKIVAPRTFWPVADESRWARNQFYRLAFIWLGSGLAAIFASDPRSLPFAAHEAVSQEIERRQTEKRSGISAEQRRSAELRGEPLRETSIEVAIENAPQEALSTTDSDAAVQAREIARIAKDRFGAKAEKYVMHLLRGEDQKKAAKEAGISDRQARKYLHKLGVLLSDR